MRSRGPRLGEILERQGALGREQLLRALRNQKVVGGRLGTCLLEIDALTEEALLRALAEQQDVPAVPPEDLRALDDEVVESVPLKVAKSNLVVPFRSSSTQVQVAMVDARDLRALDELAFVTGRRVVPHVTSEARLLEALEKYYGVECPPRFGKLLDRLNRARFLWGKRDQVSAPEMLRWDDPASGDVEEAAPRAVERPVATKPPPPPPSPFEVPPARLQEEPEANEDRAEAPELPAPPPPRAPAPSDGAAAAAFAAPAGPLAIDEAERRLMAPEEAALVGRTLVDFTRYRAETGVVFQVKKGEAIGWFAQGPQAEKLEALRVRLDRPSLFVALREGATQHRGPLGDLFAHAPLRALLGDGADREVLALPLAVRERVVAVLLVVPGEPSLEADFVSDLQRITAKAAIALELCIMRNKLKRA
ncbi:MAG TPA: hypothetical protein VLA66_10665 [Thermoanaerobaculia bacterium]|nr:hypothetical protein [Thermoanaerobaculia bacterium]